MRRVSAEQQTFKPVRRKARKLKLPEGSIRAELWMANAPITGKYSNPELFKDLMILVEESLAEGLRS